MDPLERLRLTIPLVHEVLSSLAYSYSRYLEISLDNSDKAIYRSAVVKDFELSFEVTVRLLYQLVDHKLDRVEKYKPPSRLFKEALDLRIFKAEDDIIRWEKYRVLRNRTVHVYDAGLAKSVAVAEIDAYIEDVNSLLLTTQSYVASF